MNSRCSKAARNDIMQRIVFPPTVVIIPTYNEIANLSRLVPAVLAIPSSIRLLVIDNALPDGTGRQAERLAASLGRMDVLHRPRKWGLDSAYKHVFETVLRTTGAEFICQMASNFSHRPVDLGHVIEAASGEVADIVVGSRWIPGSAVSNWPFKRFLL